MRLFLLQSSRRRSTQNLPRGSRVNLTCPATRYTKIPFSTQHTRDMRLLQRLAKNASMHANVTHQTKRRGGEEREESLGKQGNRVVLSFCTYITDKQYYGIVYTKKMTVTFTASKSLTCNFEYQIFGECVL